MKSKIFINKKLLYSGRLLFSICVIGLGVYQIIYNNLRAVLDPGWPVHIPGRKIWVFIVGIVLIADGMAILLRKATRHAGLMLGVLFLLIVIAWHLPYMIFIHPYNHHIAVWADLNKMLTLSGGAFIVAGLSSQFSSKGDNEAGKIKTSRRLITLGAIFFSLMLITFGIDHLKYVKFISPMVPSRIGNNFFWTYMTGIALIGGGIAVLFRKKFKMFIVLTGIMIFIWFIVIHIPRAIADPYVMNGNEIASALQALGFTGIAFMLGGNETKQKMSEQTDKTFK